MQKFLRDFGLRITSDWAQAVSFNPDKWSRLLAANYA